MYQISPLSTNASIDFGATGLKAKLQNAAFLLRSMKETHCMDRNCGWNIPIGDVSEVAKARMTTEVIELLEQNIIGLTVKEVIFDEEKMLEGELFPYVKVVISDD